MKLIRNKLLFLATIISTIIYLVWRIFFTIPFGTSIISIVAALALLIVEVLGMFELGIHYYNMTDIKYPERPKIDQKLFPEVDVFISTYNEPCELLYKTINGCNNMDYYDKSKVHIYLCDDGNRSEMKKLADSMNIGYITRKDRKNAKAGNLNNAMRHSNSPLIATFDADMIPMHDFLTACVPYFFTGEKVGFVQTPQSFYNPDLFQYYLFSEFRIPNEQNYFYKDIQISKNKSNSVIYGGSNTIISRQALEDAGGFYTKSITEDFATGVIIQSKGYRCYAISEVHASGLSPSDLKSLIKQRERWARGCIQTGKRLNLLFKKGLSFGQKLSYISAIYYWYESIKRFIYIMSPILFSVFGVIVVKCNLLQVLIFWLPMYLLSNASLKRLSKNIRSIKWTNVYETIMFPSLIIPVILETLGISKNKFSVTKKDGLYNDRRYRIEKAVPHIFFAGLSLLGIVNCIRMIFDLNSPAYSVILFWLIVNFYNILMAIFFMLGRKSFRNAERFSAEIDCIIKYDGNELKCTTIDISEGGIAVILDFPEYIPNGRDIKISLFDERYSCEFSVQVVHVGQFKDGWKYSFKIIDIDEGNLKKLLNIIYDREPSFPKTLDRNSSIYDDLRVNLLTRNKKVIFFSRKLPRIKLKKVLNSKECGNIEVISFNYEYLTIKLDTAHEFKNNVSIQLESGTVLNCVFEKKLNYNISSTKNQKKNIGLYKIKNYKDIIYNKEFKNLLLKWMNEFSHVEMQNIRSSKNRFSDELDEMKYL